MARKNQYRVNGRFAERKANNRTGAEEEAKHLLEKALAKDECEYNHLEDEEANEARAMLDEMEGKGWGR